MRLGPALLALPLLVISCGPPPAARDAESRILAGDLRGAQTIVDRELVRSPREPSLNRLKIRLAMARGDLPGAVASYRGWRTLRGHDDGAALRTMGITTVWSGLTAPSADVRALAVRIAERLELEEMAEGVAERLGDDDDRVRAAAAAAILTAHPDAADVLTQALSSPEPAAREIAVEVLGRKVGARAKDDILRATRDPVAGVRATALAALGRLGSEMPLEPVLALARDPEGQVRVAALGALAGHEKDPRVHDVAMTALADPYLGVRLAAVERLVGTKDAARLRPLAASKGDLLVALRAARGLTSLGERTDAPLEPALAAQDWTTRAAALNAIQDLVPAERAIALATKMLADRELAVRLAAARTLARLGRVEPALAVFRAVPADAPAEQRLSAATDLMRLGDPQGAAVLATLEREATEVSMRRAALQAMRLTAPGAAPAIDATVGALADPAGLVRLAAAERLLADPIED